jgi:hypothetical protein
VLTALLAEKCTFLSGGCSRDGAKQKDDLPLFNADPSWTLPMPHVRDRDRRGNRLRRGEPDYTKRPDPSELLPVLDRLASRRAA